MTKAPNPNTRPRIKTFPLVSINELPPLGDPAVGLGEAEEPLVGLPLTELVPAVPVELDESVVVGAAEVLEPELVAVDEDKIALELETRLPTGTTTPPCTFPEVVVEAPCAAFLYAASVSPEFGGWTTPAMPPSQWLGVPQKNHIGSVF